MNTQIVHELRDFITTQLIEDSSVQIEPTTHLIELGLIDSLSVVVLLNFVTSRYGVEVPLEELTEANLQTLEAMGDLLVRLGVSAS